MKRRVVKIGGSLADHAMWDGRVADWLDRQPEAHCVLLTGGGVWAEQIRVLDRTGTLPAESAHHLAIRAMTLLAWTLSQTEPRWPLVGDWHDLRRSLDAVSAARTVIFDPAVFLRSVEPLLPGPILPVGWEVTSDSIAARIACLLDADELVLLKSAWPQHVQLKQMVSAGYVDRYFETASRGIRRLRFVDLPSSGRELILDQASRRADPDATDLNATS